MKNKLLIGVLVVFLVLAVVFFALWQTARRDNSDVLTLAQAGAAGSLDSFKAYRERGDEADYWQAVADFRAFEQAYYLLVQGTNKSSNYIFCNEVYSELVIHPERCQEHIDEIIETMTILAADVTDENGYMRMSSLRNTLSK